MSTLGSLLAGISVLIVDDDEDDREFLGFALKRHGAHVRSVATADEALDTIEYEHPDVLVSDLSLRDKDGIAFMRELRGRSVFDGADVPAVAMSQWCRDSDREMAHDAGFQAFLPKPIQFDALVVTIARLGAASRPVGMQRI